MELTVSKKELALGVAASLDFISSSINSPALKNLFLTVDGKSMIISATDHERASRYTFDLSEVKDLSPAVVPAAGLRDFLAGAPGEVCRFSTESGKTVIRSGKSRISFRAPGDVSIPMTPLTDYCTDRTKVFSMRAEDLAEMFARTSFVTRQAIIGGEDGNVDMHGSNGVRLIAEGNVTAIAYEHARMSKYESGVASEENWQVTIPPRHASWLSSVRWGKEEVISVYRQGGVIILGGSRLWVSFTTSNFPLPDVNAVFNMERPFRAVFNTNDFTRALSTVSRFSENDSGKFKSSQITITLGEDEAVIRAQTNIGEVDAEDTVGCKHNSTIQTEILFKPSFLLEFCRTKNSDKFKMEFGDTTKTFRITHKDEPRFTYIATALRPL